MLTPDQLRPTDRLLLRCGARTAALLHPNPEPGAMPSEAETLASHAQLLEDLHLLHLQLGRILDHGHDVHPRD